MKALVTGGAGFIGSHLVDRLVSEENRVVVLDNETSTNGSAPRWNTGAENFKLDVCDFASTVNLYDGVDVVFHMAAESSIQSCIDNPVSTITNNVVGTNTVLQCCKQNRVKRFIFSSSASVYGLCESIPTNETHPKNCLNGYALSKSMGEDLCKLYWSLYGVETVCLRYFNVYGEGQPSKGQYAPVIGIFLNQAKHNSPLTVVGDGEQRRDFVHVSDVVDANIKASTLPPFGRNGWGEVYNIGCGKNYSVNDVAGLIGGELYHLPPRIGEVRNSLSNCDNANKELGWKPKVRLEDWIAQHK